MNKKIIYIYIHDDHINAKDCLVSFVDGRRPGAGLWLKASVGVLNRNLPVYLKLRVLLESLRGKECFYKRAFYPC